MALEHELRRAGAGVPELHAAVLGARQHPVGVGCEGNRQDKVTVALKRLDALAALGLGVGAAAGAAELPHLDGAVEGARDEVLAVGGERDRVDRVLVAVRAFETLDEEARVNVPDADALVERTGGDVLGVGRNGDGGNAVLDGEGEGVGAGLDVPESDGSIARARGNRTAVAGKVERVNILLVAGKVVANGSRGNVPDLNC